MDIKSFGHCDECTKEAIVKVGSDKKPKCLEHYKMYLGAARQTVDHLRKLVNDPTAAS